MPVNRTRAAPPAPRAAPAARANAPQNAPAKAQSHGLLGLDLHLDIFDRGQGPRVDPFNAAKDWMSDRLFHSLRPSGSPDQLQGPMRVAYGPINPPPTLKRPVVMIPGLTMPASSFDATGGNLAKNPANGPAVVYVASEDKFRLGSTKGRELTPAELKGAKIFQVEYQDPWASPTKKAPQIQRAMDRIAAATGQGSVDVVTHSAGGTDFRLYLENRDPAHSPRINQAVLIGPASHGTMVGNIGAVVGHPVKNVDDAARELAEGSPLIARLNADWDKQRAQLPGGVTIVGTTGTPTLGPKPGLFEDGDGYMPAAQLAMPGARLVTMEGPHKTPLAHLWQVQYPGVVNAVFSALGS